MKAKTNKSGIACNILIDDLKSEDVRKRINAVKELDFIATQLGPERTRSELIPFLNELQDDEDTVLLQLCQSLENFQDYIGGPQYIQSLFQILEWLCKCDESFVREKAAMNLRHYISKFMDISKHEDLIVGMVKRLYDSSYSNSKGPAAMIIPSFFRQISSSNQQMLLQSFLKIAKDPLPAVRKVASQAFKDFVSLYPLVSEDIILQQFNDFLKDEQDLVRLYLVDALISYSKSDLLSKNKNQFVQFLIKISEDQSWRIKYYLCEKLADLLSGIKKDLFKQNLMNVYVKYLQDSEPELRAISASRLDVASQALEINDLIELIPKLQSLATDTQSYVRQSLAGSFLTMSSVLGKKLTTEHILPIFLQLLKDEDSDVRINLFKRLNEITKILGVDTLSQSILPALSELASDKNWRIRHSSIEIISFFAKEIGADFLNDKIIQILMEWIKDSVFSVREKALEAVKNLIIYLGSPWLEKNVLPKILHQQNVPNYLHRITILLLITQIAEYLNQDYLTKTIYPVLTTLAKDPVPNVRMNVARTFKTSTKYFKDKEAIKRLLQNLCDDNDFDVRYNAKLALDSL